MKFEVVTKAIPTNVGTHSAPTAPGKVFCYLDNSGTMHASVYEDSALRVGKGVCAVVEGMAAEGGYPVVEGEQIALGSTTEVNGVVYGGTNGPAMPEKFKGLVEIYAALEAKRA